MWMGDGGDGLGMGMIIGCGEGIDGCMMREVVGVDVDGCR